MCHRKLNRRIKEKQTQIQNEKQDRCEKHIWTRKKQKGIRTEGVDNNVLRLYDDDYLYDRNGFATLNAEVRRNTHDVQHPQQGE